MKRALPAIGLFFLAPLVAEFLLGDLPVTMLGALVVLAPMYGGGALLIRELVRRTHRGWPSILVLAFAYAIFEEAFTTQTLFNPNYLHLNLHLLEPAFIPALGIGIWWTVYVLTLHTVWSISVSIGLAEALVPTRETQPWLGQIGLMVTTLLFAFGAIASTLITMRQDRFLATIPQFSVAAFACLITIIVAFRLPQPAPDRAPGQPPAAWLIGCVSLAAGSVFLLVPKQWAWWAVAAYLLLDLLMIAAVGHWSRQSAWSASHRLALAAGAAGAYAWHAFVQTPAVGGAGIADRVGNTIFAAGLVVLIIVAAKRLRPAAAP